MSVTISLNYVEDHVVVFNLFIVCAVLYYYLYPVKESSNKHDYVFLKTLLKTGVQLILLAFVVCVMSGVNIFVSQSILCLRGVEVWCWGTLLHGCHPQI